MRTEKQIQASRNNGAKSRGPVTDERKARSSKNAITHGLTSTDIATGVEDFDTFELRLAEYVDRFQPADQVEMDLVVEMVMARHKIQRITAMETAALDIEMSRQARSLEKEIPGILPPGRLACAFKGLAESSKVLDVLHRYATAARRQYDRALQNLLQIQRDRRTRETAAQNEPEPVEPETTASETVQNEPGPALTPIPAAETPAAGDRFGDCDGSRLVTNDSIDTGQH